MTREALTDARIRAIPEPARGRKIHFDRHRDAPRGFGLRVTAAGARAFVLRYSVDGKDRLVTIGDYPTWSLKAARLHAQGLRRDIDRGIDPLAEQKEKRVAAEVAERYRLRDLLNAYVAHLQATGKAGSAKTYGGMFRRFVLSSPVADKPAKDIESVELARLIRAVFDAGKARSAGSLRAGLCAAYNLAVKAPLDARIPEPFVGYGVAANPVTPISSIRGRTSDRVLSAEEMQILLRAMHDAEDMPSRALRVAIYAGGQRIAQLVRATVADWDQEQGVLRLLDGKGRHDRDARIHLLPLAPIAAGLVQDLASSQSSRGARAPLFPAPTRAVIPATDPGRRINELVRGRGLAPFTYRDVRRTVETMLASLGISKDVRAYLLSHGLSGVQTAHYDRHDYLGEKRAALEAWERHLERLIRGKADNVVELVREVG